MQLLFKVIYCIYRFSSSLRYSCERRFTRAGLTVLGALVLMGIFGLDTDSNVAYQGFALLLVLLLLAVCFGWFFHAHFSVTRLLPQFGTTGTPMTYTILAKNLGSKTEKGLVLREVPADPRPSFRDWLAMRLAD